MKNLNELKNLNHTLTNLLNDPHPGLHTWRLMLEKTLNSISSFCLDDGDNGKDPVIPAECHSDDWIVHVKFDALTWFEQAADDEIIELINCGFRGDYPSDNVAIFMAAYSREVKKLFTYIETVCNKHIGFECSIDKDDAIKWIEKERPDLASVLEEAKVEGYI